MLPQLLRLIDNPKALEVIEAVMGGRVQVNQIQARTVPAEVASEYTSWVSQLSPQLVCTLGQLTVLKINGACKTQHRDAGDQININPMHSDTLKAFTFFFDVPADGGCAAVLPGSHRVQFACNPHWSHDDDQESMGADGMPGSAAPSFVKFPCKAGTVVMYDNRIFHNVRRLPSFLVPSPSSLLSCCCSCLLPIRRRGDRRFRTPPGMTAAASSPPTSPTAARSRARSWPTPSACSRRGSWTATTRRSCGS